MLSGFDALHALCGEGGDRRRGWEFVRALIAALGRPVIEGDGVDASRLEAAEDRVGITLPVALREAYLLFGLRRNLTATQDRLVLPEHLRIDANGVLVFRVEAQHCASWGVPAGSEDDPAVVVNIGDGWVAYSDRLSLALIEVMLSEVMFSADEGNVENRKMDDAAGAALGAAFQRLPLPDFPLWAGMDGPPIRWFAGAVPSVPARSLTASNGHPRARTAASLRCALITSAAWLRRRHASRKLLVVGCPANSLLDDRQVPPSRLAADLAWAWTSTRCGRLVWPCPVRRPR